MRVAIAGILCATWSSVALAGNDDGVPVGNEAALRGGAVVSTVSDSSALYHNVAGIGWADTNKVDGSGKPFRPASLRLPRTDPAGRRRSRRRSHGRA